MLDDGLMTLRVTVLFELTRDCLEVRDVCRVIFPSGNANTAAWQFRCKLPRPLGIGRDCLGFTLKSKSVATRWRFSLNASSRYVNTGKARP